jgi:hypothetical protein
MRIYLLSLQLTLLVAFLVAPVYSHAAAYFVSDVRTSDADPNLAKSVKSLVTSSVTSAGEQVADTEASADYVLRSDLVKLGGSYILTVTKTRQGQPLYTSKQKAATVEELDDASDRAVRAAIIGTPTKKDTRVGEVRPQDENKIRQRILSRSTTYFGFGPAEFVSMGDTKLAYDFALGHNWEVTPQAQIRILGNIVSSSDWKTYYGDALLGLNLFLNDEDTSPYLGAGLGFGFSGSAYSSATTLGSFAAMAGIGCQFFRTSSTQFDIFAGYSTQFANNTIGTPGAFGLRIGVLF